jgi:hypothetical protein
MVCGAISERFPAETPAPAVSREKREPGSLRLFENRARRACDSFFGSGHIGTRLGDDPEILSDVSPKGNIFLDFLIFMILRDASRARR